MTIPLVKLVKLTKVEKKHLDEFLDHVQTSGNQRLRFIRQIYLYMIRPEDMGGPIDVEEPIKKYHRLLGREKLRLTCEEKEKLDKLLDQVQEPGNQGYEFIREMLDRMKDNRNVLKYAMEYFNKFKEEPETQ